MEKNNVNTTTALAIVVIATAVVLVGGLAIIPTATQEVYANHQALDRNGPNPSETGIENAGIDHGEGLGDHGCEHGPGSDDPGSNGYQQGALSSGSECKLESVVE